MSLPRARSKASVVADFRRAQILEAARASFGRHGLRHVTMDDIAKRARLAKGTLYLYYRSKERILADALREGIDGWHAVTVPELAGGGSIDNKLEHFFAATLDYFDRRRDFFHLCHAELAPELRQLAGRQLKAVCAAQTRAWDAALRDAGVGVRGRRSGRIATMIVSLAFGLASQRVRGWIDGSIDRDVAEASRLISKGLVA